MGLPDPVTGHVGRPEWSKAFPTKDAADAHQRELRTRIANNTYTADRGMTVGEFLLEWIARKEAAERKTSTLVSYRSIITYHLVPNLGAHRLGALRPDHVQAMIDKIAKTPSTRSRTGSTSSGTLLNIRAALRAALNDAVRKQLIGRNVAELVELPVLKRPKPRSVGGAPLDAFLAQVEDDPLSALWLTDAVYGMRRAELVGLRWEDVDEGQRLIQIRQTLLELPGTYGCAYCSGEHSRIKFESPKSEAGERVYPLVPAVEAALLAHRFRQNDERELYGDGYADHGLVFAQPDGNPWRPGRISDQFKRHLKAAGVIADGERVPPMKTLRSTAFTALHEAGLDLEAIAPVIGHSGTKVGREHYLVMSAERTRTEFESIASRLTGQSQ